MGPRGGLCVQMSQSNDAYIGEKEQNSKTEQDKLTLTVT